MEAAISWDKQATVMDYKAKQEGGLYCYVNGLRPCRMAHDPPLLVADSALETINFDPSVDWPRVGNPSDFRPRPKILSAATSRQKQFKLDHRKLWKGRGVAMRQLELSQYSELLRTWSVGQEVVNIIAESISEVLFEHAYTSELFDRRVGRADACFETWLIAVMAIRFDTPTDLSWRYAPEISRAIRRVYLEPQTLSSGNSVRLLTD